MLKYSSEKNLKMSIKKKKKQQNERNNESAHTAIHSKPFTTILKWNKYLCMAHGENIC